MTILPRRVALSCVLRNVVSETKLERGELMLEGRVSFLTRSSMPYGTSFKPLSSAIGNRQRIEIARCRRNGPSLSDKPSDGY
jgi:hypothetical protein